MSGPPGTGKSMLAARFPGILPQMTQQEALESAAMQSLGGMFEVEKWKVRPFRNPHHTASAVALVGGGCDFSKLLRLARNKCDSKPSNLFLYNPYSFTQNPNNSTAANWRSIQC
jgi:magnesium chelatase family protein